MPRAIRLADRVVCVSRATARDVAGLLGVPESRLRVVPNGVDALFSEPAGAPPVEGPYILFVGTPEPRKNLPRLLGRRRELAGRGTSGAPRARRRRRLGRRRAAARGSRRAARPRPGRDAARPLRPRRGCAAYPSLWEGFGLVAGEALAAGCPLVCADVPALREVAGSRRRRTATRSRSTRSPTRCRAALDGPRPSPRRPFTWESAARALSTSGGSSRERPPLVLVDADTIGRARTGDEAYTVDLLRELPGAAPDLRSPARCATRRRCPTTCRRGAPARAARRLAVPAHSVRASRAWRAGAARPSCTSSTSSRRACRCPAVVTVHDLSFARRPELFTRRDRLLLGRLVPGSLRRARRVIAVSEFTRGELLDRYGLDPASVVAIPNGVGRALPPRSPRPRPRRARRFGLERPFVLFVGALQPRKNAVTPGRRLRPRCAGIRRRRARARRRRSRRLGEVRDRVPRALGLGGACASLGHVVRGARFPGSTAPPSCSRSRRCTRASGCRRSRRWPAARRSAPARRRGSARPSATRG